ncbi:hypothetical protein D2A34_18805 [Clostridium chromiireducens]|uniref:Uncharacterized protein n=1 Tax=Clostridium chromiireducens TaxID=225345 RepID=A0A399IK66_9CLOT|nr:hypothetical protein [Clostridium chromiireducens]RII32897.1 hypothetical protein D2A34_18805 [Clostridium chromiireducens]
MKRFSVILFIFLLISLNINSIHSSAQLSNFSQGFYTMKDLGLSENIPYSVQNLSPYNRGVVIVMDENQMIQQLLRIQPSSPKYTLTPLKNSFRFIIYGDGVQLAFS